MLSKLVLRNAGRSLKLYMIYLFTMILVAALMFSFHSMIFSEEIRSLSQEAGMFGILILMANVFIVLIMVWLIHYMVSFMAQQRGKEFGIYMLLGFRRKQIARLFLMENMVLGAAALIIGTVPGIFFQQVLTSAIYGILETE